jgi:hypothetical protein
MTQASIASARSDLAARHPEDLGCGQAGPWCLTRHGTHSFDECRTAILARGGPDDQTGANDSKLDAGAWMEA